MKDGTEERAGKARGGSPAGSEARATRSVWRSVAIGIVKVLIAAALVYWLARSGGIHWQKLARLSRSADTVALAFAAIGVTFIFAIMRWWVLLRAVDVSIPLPIAAKLTFIGGFFNTFMPGAVGGDAFKMYYVVEHAPEGRRVEAAATVAMDRLIGLGAMFILVAVASSIAQLMGATDNVVAQIVHNAAERIGPFGKPLGVLLTLGAILSFASFHPGVRDWRVVRRVLDRLPGAGVRGRVFAVFLHSVRSPTALVLAALLSCAAHISTVICFFIVGRALGEAALPFGRYVIIVPIGLIVNAFPITPAGIGVGEGAYSSLFAMALGPAAESPGADICAIWRIVTIAWNLVGGVVYVFHRRGGHATSPLKLIE